MINLAETGLFAIAAFRNWPRAPGSDVPRKNTAWPRLDIAICYSTIGSCHGIMLRGGSYIRRQAGIARISMAPPIARHILVAG